MKSEESLRLLPRNGEPRSIGERISQRLIKIIAWLPVYTAIIVTLTFIVIFFESR